LKKLWDEREEVQVVGHAGVIQERGKVREGWRVEGGMKSRRETYLL